MNINDYDILRHFYTNNIFCQIGGYTIKDLTNSTQYSYSKIRNAVKLLTETGYLREGAYKKNAKTYYCTDKGINKMKEIALEMKKREEVR